ncbi:MAG: fused MFS/spermidine synthase [Pseudomonadota bacterium]
MVRVAPLSLSIFFLSGFSALGYQLIWVRQFTAALGHELPAAFAVIGAFLGGLAIGAFALNRVGKSQRPDRWYAALELAIGSWALVTLALIEPVTAYAYALLGVETEPLRYWSVAFVLTFLTLLPATVAMGGTLAAAEHWFARIKAQERQISAVYAINTAGAAAGALLAPFLLMPALGLMRALICLAAINIGIAMLVLAIGRGSEPTPASNAHNEHKPTPRDAQKLAARLFAAGFLGIGFEVLGVRIMAQLFEGTVYSFSAALTTFLVGTAIGSSLFPKIKARWDPRRRLSYLAAGLSVTVLIGFNVLANAQPAYRMARRMSEDLFSILIAELGLSIAVFGLSTILMGILFCHLAEEAQQQRRGIGWALGTNTLGGMLAPGILAVFAIPTMGTKWAAVVLGLGYLALIPRPWALPRWAPAVPLLVAGLLPEHLRIVTLRPDESVIAYNDGVVASVAVTKRNQETNLRVDNRFQMGGTSAAALRVQRLQAHLPLLLHPNPNSVLFLGVATGITSGAGLLHNELKIDAVELSPEVLQAIPFFNKQNGRLKDSSRVDLHNADARRFIRTSEQKFDVIVGDLFQPARDGAGLLYTAEHFASVRERLNENGMFCQWLPIYQMDIELVRVITGTFLAVFPHVEAWLGNIGTDYPVVALIGSNTIRNVDTEQLRRRMAKPALAGHLARSAIRGPVQLLGHQIADHQTLTDFSKNTPLNTDDFPVVLFRAPSFTFRRVPSYTTLVALQNAFEAEKSIAQNRNSYPEDLAVEVDRFVGARDEYLQGLVAINEGQEATGHARLLGAVKQSDKFTLAYAQVVNLAIRAAAGQPERATKMLEDLRDAQPTTPIANRVLRKLRQQGKLPAF